MDLKTTQLKDTFGNLLTIGTTAGTPTTGILENGNGDDITTLNIQNGTARGLSFGTDTSGTGSRAFIVLDPDGSDGIGSGSDYLFLAQDGTTVTNLQIPDTSVFSLKDFSSTRLTIQADGKVGIGTTSNTTFALEVVATASDGVFAVKNGTNDANTFRSSNASGTRTLDIGNNSSGHGILNIRNSSGTVNTQLLGSGDSYFNGGNVGIGTSSPSATLQVEGDVDVRTASNKNLHIRSLPSFDNFSNQGVGISMSRTSSDADLMALGVVDTDKLGLFSRSGIIFAIGGSNAFQHTTEAVRIDGSGNVGIGTTDPDSILHLESASSPKLIIKDTTNNCQYITYAQNSNAHLGTSSNHDLMIDTNNTTRMTVKSTGNVEITNKLLINTTDSSPNTTEEARIVAFNTSDGTRCAHFGVDSTSGSTLVLFTNPNGLVGFISTSASATTYSTTSDYRLKENVVPMEGALDRISQLKPSRFNFIADANTTVDGFLAHEVANVVPEAITGEKDETKDDGTPVYQGIDQSKLVPLLVGAIQELKAEIEQLKNK